MATDYRHEWKHFVSVSDMIVLRQRLQAVAAPDANMVDGRYTVHSLYFDTGTDRALREKLDGVNRREKFRIRYYNSDPTFLHLEKKSKWNALSRKETAALTVEEVQALIDGAELPSHTARQALVWELCYKMTTEGLRAKTIVDYTREAFVYGPGNVRVTLDYDIHMRSRCADFLTPGSAAIPVQDTPHILEVKWDCFLPDIIRDAVRLENRHAAAFSKYAACRMYG